VIVVASVVWLASSTSDDSAGGSTPLETTIHAVPAQGIVIADHRPRH